MSQESQKQRGESREVESSGVRKRLPVFVSPSVCSVRQPQLSVTLSLILVAIKIPIRKHIQMRSRKREGKYWDANGNKNWNTGNNGQEHELGKLTAACICGIMTEARWTNGTR